MYDEFICNAIPLLISGDKFKYHNIAELKKARNYWEQQGDLEKVKDYDELIERILLGSD